MREGDVFYEPGKQWLGKIVVCLGGGDSLRRLEGFEWNGLNEIVKQGHISIAVNSSIKVARANGHEPNVLMFTDMNWYEDNEKLINEFEGQVWSFSRRARAVCDKLLRINNVHKDNFKVFPSMLRDGRSTGHRAVSLGVYCGAKKVILLGYDMQIDPVSGRSHCHDDYKDTEGAKSYAQEFIPSFKGWFMQALDVGTEIVNCSSTTALEEFPKGKLMNELFEELEQCA